MARDQLAAATVSAPRPFAGQSVPRVDAEAKLRAQTAYLLDRVRGEAWFGGTVRSPVAHGRLRALHFDRHFDFSRVVLLRPHEIPGENTVAMVRRDMPCLAEHELNYLGEPILLVAAADRATLAEALAAIRVEAEPLPALVGIDAVADVGRRQPDALHDLHALEITKGQMTAGWAEADLIVEGEYFTSPQEHLYLEPQAIIAEPLAGGVHIAGSLQCPYYVQTAVAIVLDVGPEQVRVEQWPTGGAFGGKEDYPSVIACHAALLARKCGRPVVIDLDRRTDIEVTTKRHASWTRLRTGVTRDGRLTALDAQFVIDGGAYVTLSPVVLSRGAIHLSGPYRWPHVHVRARAVRTHTPPAGAFRGFGAPQAIYAIEAHLDEVAARLGISPLALRQRNLLGQGDTTATGQVLRHGVGIRECLDGVLQTSDYQQRTASLRQPGTRHGDHAHGIGLALFWHGGGFTGAGEQKMAPRAAVELTNDGHVHVLVANTEFGQGAQTVLRQIAADACGVPLEFIDYPLPDTARVPNSGPTVASRTTMVVGRLVERACRQLLDEIGRRLQARREGPDFVAPGGRRWLWHEAAAEACGEATLRCEAVYEGPAGYQWDDQAHRGDAYAAYSWGAVVTRVSVDQASLEVRCDEVWCVVDVGTVINPREARGQVEGGLTQALGFALMERISYDDAGRVRENRLQTYVIPTAADVPPMHVAFVEVPYEGGPFGAKGLGELPMNGLGPALRNAVRDALGAAPARLPMTPDVIFAALSRGAGRQR